MESAQKEALCQQLDTADTSLTFLVLLILASLLSWKAAALQREALCQRLAGEGTPVPDVYPLRLAASAIVVGSLIYFFGLALRTQTQAQSQDELSRRSAHLNVCASVLVLAAALIRLYDLNFVQHHQPSLETEILPD